MNEILIRYRDGSGDITERRISDFRRESATTIDAFCHLRNARRPFKLDRIVQAHNPDTGEVINPYQLVGQLLQRDRETLESLTLRVIPAIKALKFFSLSTRGFAKRERERVVQFMREIVDVSAYSSEEIDEWIYNLWCGDLFAYRDGDTTEYTETLKNIPNKVLGRCREYALFIARGSGRRPVESNLLERVATEFSINPMVIKPDESGRTCIEIKMDTKMTENEADLVSRKVGSIESLIVLFVDGYAAGWEFAVKESFKDALDIKKSGKTIKEKIRKVWTLGNKFSFKRGDTLHNHVSAYENFAEFLQGINPVVLQVQDSLPNDFGNKTIDSITSPEINYQKFGKSAVTLEKTKGFRVRDQVFYNGLLIITEYRPNEAKNEIVKTNEFEIYQEAFVSLLRSGKYYDAKVEIERDLRCNALKK